ncbi:helix-turn-helix domain-containing protein [Streptomyces albipurpureus]|uniref:Helix-turn-helix transcriptional regulator n=1 Tax=Streptomyces albipurpureus TaxID=2897419 RepID=A0ABT0UUI2_9ACTN|nr:helix-turn-helix transcriptional regulator [Streptomyces sp. CWNU-1]MCM2392247.1 helix-turn-helix transcriptional regulator [Streptomyces sp. CWNU-1]
MSTTELPPGANLAALRKAHGLSQAQLARKASVSLSLLSKIEVGDRALTPAVASALGKPMGLSMAEVLGRTTVARGGKRPLAELRAALRDYDLPQPQTASGQKLKTTLATASRHRKHVEVDKLLKLLPALLRDATTEAHTENTPEGWMLLADVYSHVYWLAARHRWMDMAELAVARQRWAVEQRPNPLGRAVAARDRAGTYLNFGDIERGLNIVDRAISDAERELSGTDRDIAVCILNLRGMTLAGRLGDKGEAKKEAARHIRSALAASVGVGKDRDVHGLTVGPQNAFAHQLATYVDLGRPRDALALTDDLTAALAGLPPTRTAPTYINAARAQLDIGDRDGALENLSRAWGVAPQMARIHPMGREVFRVVSSLHRRSNSEILKLSKLSGIAL